MRFFRYGIYIVLITLSLSATAATATTKNDPASRPISFVIAPDVLANYQKFLGGRLIHEVMDIDTRLHRDTLEVFITLYALHQGGLTYFPEFVTTPSLERHIALLKSGSVAMSAALIDVVDLETTDNIFVAPSLFENQTKLVGLYTAPGNERALSASSRADVKQLTAISNKSWHADWRALQDVELAGIVSVADWVAMCRMVVAGRVDFLLAPRRQQTLLDTPVGPLVLMRPFAVNIQAARKFAIANNHKESEALKHALSNGLQQIGQDHFIQDAIRQLDPPQARSELLIILNEAPGS